MFLGRFVLNPRKSHSWRQILVTELRKRSEVLYSSDWTKSFKTCKGRRARTGIDGWCCGAPGLHVRLLLNVKYQLLGWRRGKIRKWRIKIHVFVPIKSIEEWRAANIKKMFCLSAPVHSSVRNGFIIIIFCYLSSSFNFLNCSLRGTESTIVLLQYV